MAGKRAAEERRHLRDLKNDPENRRLHNPRNIGLITDALQQVGAARSIVIDEDDVILAGNGVREAAADAGITNVRVIEVSGHEIIAVRRRGLTAEQKRKLAMFDNRAGELATWNADQLRIDQQAGLDLRPWFSPEELAAITAQEAPAMTPAQATQTLSERFGVPPFSVLDARQGYWQDRKRAWLALGIESELGRGGPGQPNAAPGGAPLPGVRGPRKDYKPGQGKKKTVQ